MNGRFQSVFQVIQHHGRISNAFAELLKIALSLAVLRMLRIYLFQFDTVDIKHIRRAILLQKAERKATYALHNDVRVVAEQLSRCVVDHVPELIFKIVGALRQRVKESCQGFSGLLSRDHKVEEIPVGLRRHGVLLKERVDILVLLIDQAGIEGRILLTGMSRIRNIAV